MEIKLLEIYFANKQTNWAEEEHASKFAAK